MADRSITLDEVHEVLNERGLYVARDLSPREAIAAVIRLLRAGSEPEGTKVEQWGVRSREGLVFTCNSENHAKGMMRTTSTVVPGKSGERTLIKRTDYVGDWEEV